MTTKTESKPEITKFQTSEPVIINRQSIVNAPYNPRKISDYAMKELKKNLKRVGLLGGIVVNRRTMHIVSGHQRLLALDQIEKTQDYNVRVEMVDFDEKTEIEQNIFMNSTTVQGQFDLSLLKDLIPQIDFEMAGLDRYDLNQLGVEIPQPITAEVETITAGLSEMVEQTAAQTQIENEVKKQAIKDLKENITEKAAEKAADLEAYIVISFDNMENKAEFLERFGFSPTEKYLKGEVFGDMIEFIG